jgi:hypothetical protein
VRDGGGVAGSGGAFGLSRDIAGLGLFDDTELQVRMLFGCITEIASTKARA